MAKAAFLPSTGLHSCLYLNFTFWRQQCKERTAKRTLVLQSGSFRLCFENISINRSETVMEIAAKSPFPQQEEMQISQSKVQCPLYKMSLSTEGMLQSF